jgi:tetratricopeptide (TPR) repeat protein
MSWLGVILIMAAGPQEGVDLKELSKKCGSDIPWIQDSGPRGQEDRAELFQGALAKAKERNRPVLWYVYRVQKTPFWKPEHLDRYMMTGPFADEEIADLIRRKFVPLKIVAVPDVGKPYEIVAGKFAFLEPGLAFFNGNGELLHKMDRLRSLSPDFLLNTLRLVLEKYPALNAPSEPAQKAEERLRKEPSNVEARLALALEQIKDADYAKAKETLGKALGAAQGEALGRAHYVNAILHRRRFEFDEALRALEQASKLLTQAGSKGDALSERGLVLLKTGKLAEAAKAYESMLESHPRAPRAAEAAYCLGACDYLSAKDAKAVEVWRKLADAHPESPWAWKGASSARKMSDCFLGDGALARGFEDPVCPPAAALAELRSGSEWPRTRAEAPDASRRAAEFLLRRQRSDGSWSDSRYTFGQGPVILSNVWVAITSLCCSALLEWRSESPERIDKALEMGAEYLKAAGDKARGKFETCYADSYRLMYLSRRAGVFPNEKEKLTGEMNELAGKLSALQEQNGFWGHEYPNPFATATAIQGLVLAKAAGATVSEESVKRGLEAIKGSAGPNGWYPYSTEGASEKKDAAGRTVNCELALYLAEKGSTEALARSIDTFLEVLPRWERVRKTGFHADGQLGGFFFFYSFHPATQAARLLGPDQRARILPQFLDRLLQIAEIDGSFGEDPTMGKSFSTAMGLLSLRGCLTD